LNSIKIYMVGGVICLCLLAGCAGEEATPTKAVLFEEPTVDLQATIDAAVQETQAAAVTDTPVPTDTPAPTDTPEPTETPEPTDTPQPEATDTPRPTIPVVTRAPEPEAAAEIIQAHAFIDEDNTVNIIGVIENQGDLPLEYVKIAVNLSDAEGNFLDTDYTYSVLDIIWPGQKSPFWLRIRDITTDQLGYDLILEADGVDPAEVDEIPMGPEGLEISDSAAKWGDYAYEIAGIVTNNTSQPVEYVKIAGVLYDTNGHIMGTDYTYTTLDVIPADSSSPFELRISRDEMAALDPEGNPAEISSYELVVEGSPVD
jgi:hypothetical protein